MNFLRLFIENIYELLLQFVMQKPSPCLGVCDVVSRKGLSFGKLLHWYTVPLSFGEGVSPEKLKLKSLFG